MNEKSNGNSKRAFVREAIAYASGHCEAYLEQFSKGIGIPFDEIAHGVSGVLVHSGNRATVSLPQVWTSATGEPEVLQPAVAVAGGAREPRKLPQAVKAHKGHSRRKIHSKTVAAIKLRHKRGESFLAIARKLGVSDVSVRRYALGKEY